MAPSAAGQSLGDLSKWPLLQNKIKRDPGGYVDEFSRALLHFRSSLELFRLKPSADDRELPALLSFVSNVAPCYAKREDVRSLGAELMAVLEAHADALTPTIRMSLVQALILLRNRGLAPHVEVLALFFKLFRTHDRPLRRYLHEHIVGEIKSVNIKRKNHALNRSLQNFMYGMLADENVLAARHSLDVIIELYRRQVWTDAKTVNVIATGAFHKSGHMVAVTLRFLLGRDVEEDEDGADSDDDDETHRADPEERRNRVRAFADAKKLALNSQLGRVGKKKRKLERAQKALSKGSGGANARRRGQFSPVALLNDPQGFAERLLQTLRTSQAKFELRLLMMALVSQLVASHQLLLLNYYAWLQKYVQPHQPQVTQILAYAAQACHALVPPDALEPVVRAIVSNFVSDRSRSEVIAIGLNTLREICVRVPSCLDETLLQDLVQYRKDRDKNVVAAARSLVAVYRDKYPELLHRRDRGKKASLLLQAHGAEALRPAVYGAVSVATGVAGVELLQEDDERVARGEPSRARGSDDEDEDEGSDEELGSEVGDEEIDRALDGLSDDDGEEGEEDGSEGGSEEGEEGEEDSGEEGSGSETEEEEASGSGSGSEEEEEEGKTPTPTRQQAASAAPPAADTSAKRIDVSRLLTDEDFARLRKLRLAHANAQLSAGGRKRKAADCDDAPSATLRADILQDEAIDPLDLEGMRARKRANKEERLASIHEGRTDRSQFGHKRKKSETGGLTNREKAHTKNFMMHRHKAAIAGKVLRKESDKQRLQRKSSKYKKNKKCGRR